jgi:hypothetical protein
VGSSAGSKRSNQETEPKRLKKDGLFLFASPSSSSSSQISETRSKNRQVDQSIFSGPQDIWRAQASKERETKNYRRSNQSRPGKRDERGEGADAGPARQRSEMGSTGPNFSRGELGRGGDCFPCAAAPLLFRSIKGVLCPNLLLNSGYEQCFDAVAILF